MTEPAALPQTAESIGVLRGSLAAKGAGEFIAEVCELAALDGSLGWLAAMFNAGAYELARLPEHAADVVWGSDPDALITTSHRGDGGIGQGQRLTGRWESVVGAEYAHWLLLPAGTACRVLVPRSAARIEPVRNPVGLDTAGVCDVTISGSEVDDSHVFNSDSAGAALIAVAGAAAAVVGSADGVWRHHIGQERARLATSFGGDEATNAAYAQVARAASDIDAAKLQVVELLHRSDDVATAMWVYQQAVARARGAADRLLGNSRHALDASDPVTRQWRDVHAGYRLTVRFLDRP